MKTVALCIIAGVFLLQFVQSINKNRYEKLVQGAYEACGGVEKTQWIQLGGLWGGFGWGCMPH